MDDQEFEFEDMQENDDGSIDFFLPDDDELVELEAVPEQDHYENLSEYIDEESLEQIGREVVEAYENDLSSRSEWIDITVEGFENLGLEYDDDSGPFDGACTASHPLVLQSAVSFQSKASNELLNAKGPAKTQILGKKTPEREAQGKRVKDHLNYQLTEVITEYYPETEKMLFTLGLTGNAFKRKYFDGRKKRPGDEFLLPDRVVVNSNAKDLQSAERISVRIDYTEREMKEEIASGNFEEPVDGLQGSKAYEPSTIEEAINGLQGTETATDTKYDGVYEVIEQQVYLEIDPETLEYDPKKHMPLPYIVWVDKDSEHVYAIKKNWASYDNEKKCRCEWVTHYSFIPSTSFYALGYIHLLGNFQLTLTSIMRALVDSGQFANMQGGFKSSQLKIADDEDGIAPGQFKDVDFPPLNTKLADHFYALPYKEPSAVLLQMYTLLDERGQRFADSTDQVISDSSNYGPVGTTMALLEASTKFFAAIYKRCYFSQKHELRILGRMNYEFGEDFYPYDGLSEFNLRDDFNPYTLDIVPVADPNYTSQAQRISKAQSALSQMLQGDPEGKFHDKKELFLEFYTALGYENPERFLVQEQEPKPLGPVEDIMMVTQNKPIRAFPEQDHKSHVQVKMAFLEDPASGASPQMAQHRPAIQANIQEHLVLQYTASLQALAQQMPIEQAAQRLARLNQIAVEEEQEGSPAKLLADAAMMEAETERRKQIFDEQIQSAEILIDLQKLEIEAAKVKETGDLKEFEVLTKAMIEKLKLEMSKTNDVGRQDSRETSRKD